MPYNIQIEKTGDGQWRGTITAWVMGWHESEVNGGSFIEVTNKLEELCERWNQEDN